MKKILAFMAVFALAFVAFGSQAQAQWYDYDYGYYGDYDYGGGYYDDYSYNNYYGNAYYDDYSYGGYYGDYSYGNYDYSYGNSYYGGGYYDPYYSAYDAFNTYSGASRFSLGRRSSSLYNSYSPYQYGRSSCGSIWNSYRNCYGGGCGSNRCSFY